MQFNLEPVRALKRRLLRAREGNRTLLKNYKAVTGKDFDSNDLRTHTDKLYERMIAMDANGDRSLTHLADKLLVREFVKRRVGEEYLIKLLWSGADPEKIPFGNLPQQAFIKTNHGSGGHFRLDHRTDHLDLVRKLRQALKTNYYWASREYQYYDIEPKVLIEETIDDGDQNGPLDYRFWCFQGKPAAIQVDDSRHSINPFYDLEWTKLSLHNRVGMGGDAAKPQNLDKMIEIASRLSAGFDFVRVDLYNIRGRILFGEMTFTPGGGSWLLRPECWEERLGLLW